MCFKNKEVIISIKNIGIVEEATIDLSNKLIVLCGPNNSGKTYIAYALYGLLRSAFNTRLSSFLGSGQIAAFLGENIDSEKWEVNLLELLKSNDYEVLRTYVAGYSKNLSDVFASDSGSFLRARISIDEIDPVTLEETIRKTPISLNFRYTANSTYHFEKPIGNTTLRFFLESRGQEKKTGGSEPLTQRDIVDYFIPNLILTCLFPKSFIAPTQRTAVNIFSTELSIKRNQLVDELLKAREKTNKDDAFSILNEARRYTLPIRDSLITAEDLVNLEKQKSEFGFLSDELEKSVLKGKITISKEGEVQYSPNTHPDQQISVNLSGSMVNSLSGLVFYFRHLAKEGDFIILDEPELNLHPDNQIKVARFLCSVINAGFSVLVSTHSDYVIHEFNNMILLNGVSDENFTSLAKKWDYKQSNKLNSNSTQVLLFEAKKNGKIIAKDITVDKDGFAVTPIDNIIKQLNESSADIFLSANNI